MADVDHPKTHVEDDEDVKLPRKQPESPHREGIDPLTESDTMYPAEDVKGASQRAGNKEEKEATEQLDSGELSEEDQKQADMVQDQEERAVDPAGAKEKADETQPGQADDPTPDAGEKAEAQEPHTDAGNTSPANRTTSTSSKKKS